MALADLSDSDLKIVGEALRAAADPHLFPEWEFYTLFGLNRSEVADIAAAWPDVAAGHPDVDLAVNNAIANLIGYPFALDVDWNDYPAIRSSPLLDILERWRLPRRARG